MRVVLDTNVIVAAVATRGLCADVVREVLAHHELVGSEDLLREVEKVLRAKLHVPEDLASEVAALIRESAALAEPSGTIDILIAEPGDKALLLASAAGGANLFVTGDRELLEIAKLGQMDIVSPRAFWERIRGK